MQTTLTQKMENVNLYLVTDHNYLLTILMTKLQATFGTRVMVNLQGNK